MVWTLWDMLRNFYLHWQSEVKTDQIDESGAYYADMLEKIERLIKSKMTSVNAADRVHYRSILLIIDSLKK